MIETLTLADPDHRTMVAARRKLRRGALHPMIEEVYSEIDPFWFEHRHQRRWRRRAAEYRDFLDEHHRMPSQTSADPVERDLGQWIAAQRRYHRDGRMSEGRQAHLESINGHTWEPFADTWSAMFDLLCCFIDEFRRVPSKRDTEHMALARWYGNQQVAGRRGDLAAERLALISGVAGEGWLDFVDRWGQSLNAYRQFVIERGRLPSRHSVDLMERRIGEWVHRVKADYNRGSLTGDRISLVEDVPGHEWGARRAGVAA